MAKRKATAKRSRKAAAKRELINTGKDKRFVRRRAKGRFEESDDVGRSLQRDRQQTAKRKVKSGQGGKAGREIGATGKVFVFFSNPLGCAGFAAGYQGGRRGSSPGGV